VFTGYEPLAARFLDLDRTFQFTENDTNLINPLLSTPDVDGCGNRLYNTGVHGIEDNSDIDGTLRPNGWNTYSPFGELGSLFLKATYVDISNELSDAYSQLSSSIVTTTPLLRYDPTSTVYDPVFPHQVLIQDEVKERNRWGQEVLMESNMGFKVKYNYPDLTLTANDLCEKWLEFDFGNIPTGSYISRIDGYQSNKALLTTFHYDSKGRNYKTVSPNNEISENSFDKLDRITDSYLNTLKIKHFNYHTWDFKQKKSWNFNLLKTFYDIAEENYQEEITFLNSDGSEQDFRQTNTYYDPLTRMYNTATAIHIQGQEPVGSDGMVHSGETIYDLWGRAEKQYTNFLYSASPPISFMPRMSTSNSQTTYITSQYEDTQRGRPINIVKPGNDLGRTVRLKYSLISSRRMLYELKLSTSLSQLIVGSSTKFMLFDRKEKIDEDRKRVIEYLNPSGLKVAEMSFINNSRRAVTLYSYDVSGNLIEVINPELQSTLYQYNHLGQLTKKTTVDGGSTLYAYDMDGKLNLEIDANGQTNPNNNQTNAANTATNGKGATSELNGISLDGLD
jgi:YD repeat-containing protein